MNLKPLGQEQAWKSLLRFSENSPAGIPQSLLLTGPAGVGKKRAAIAFFQWINCSTNPLKNGADAPCGQCGSCVKISSSNHTDLILLQPDGDSIPVDHVREMKKALHYPPMEGLCRFVILDNAHKLNASSANTLLKTLEEAPTHTRFFLITHEKALLLPTILSRCQFVTFNPLTSAVLKEVLALQGIELPARLSKLCFDLLCGGVEHASHFAEEKTIEFLTALLGFKASQVQVGAFADMLSSEDWKLKLFLDFLSVQFKNQATQATHPEKIYDRSQCSLEAAYLNRRLEKHANKKLIALAASQLSQRM